MTTKLLSLLAVFCAAILVTQTSALAYEPATLGFQLTPAETRIQEAGLVQEDGTFTLWDNGTIGDHLVVPRDSTVRVTVRAAGHAQDDIPARLAVDLLPVGGRPIRAGVLEVRSAQFLYQGKTDYADYSVDVPLGKGYYLFRITHLNRTVREGKWRHCFVAGLEIQGAVRADCSPAAYAFFGSAEDTTDREPQGETLVIDAQQIRVKVSPELASWSVVHGSRPDRASGIRPAFRIEGLPVDLSTYGVEVTRELVSDKALGTANRVTMRYHKPGELDITYCLIISQEAAEVVARVDMVNRTQRSLVIDSIAPMAISRLHLGEDVSDWSIIGDGKQYRDPYQLVPAAELDELECWWYTAMENRADKRSILLGSLQNNKGLGRFLVTRDSAAGVRLAAYHDYERITMPPGASIIGEATLLQFGEKGTDSLERFGDLVAAVHDIHLRRDFPLDPHDPIAVTLFNSWGGYGASVVSRFPYKNDADPAKRKHAYRNRDWDRANRNQIYTLGLNDFGYAGGAWDRLANLQQRPLARHYGQLGEFDGKGPLLADRGDWYREGKIDFSNPEVVKFEKNQIAEAIQESRAEETGAMVVYHWDFTNEWRTLPGQYNPFLTGAETYRTALGLWRDATEACLGGGCGCIYMNSIGVNYGLAKIMRVGEDSDRGYYADDVFTQHCTFTEGLVRQLSGRYFYNGRVFWINPDSFHVYVGGLYTHAQAKTHASFCAIAGNRMSVAEPFVEYDEPFPEDRLEIIRRVAPTTGDVAIAVDLFEHCPARLWNMPIRRPFGRWNVAALFNTDHDRSGQDVTQTIRFEDLELSPNDEYLVHEFWSNQFLGVHQGGFTRTLKAPDCEVYSIVRKQEHPVLVSTSRHVRQMAYEVLDLAWDAETRTLRGTSKVSRNDPYQLRVFVPEGYKFQQAKAAGLEVDVRQDESILAVNFTSARNEEIDWEVAFR